MGPLFPEKPPPDTYAEAVHAEARQHRGHGHAPSGRTGPAGDPALAPGASVADRYEIVRFIAAAAMGEVYEALDRMLGTAGGPQDIRPELVARPHMLERFRREILLARRVTHHNVCRIFDLGQEPGVGAGPGADLPDHGAAARETLRERLARGR
jgi:hypothetical protein